MPVLPINLPSGVIAVYGAGSITSQSGIISETEQWKYASVYQIWDGGQAFVYGGDMIMFKENMVLDRLVYEDSTYTLLPARLVTKEVIVP